MANWNLQAILRDLGAAWRLFWDPKVPALLKLLLPVAAVLYWVWPIDLIPGIPLDDIAILILALRLFVQVASPATPAPSAPSASADDENTIDTTWRVIKDNG
ncbi:MAG: hypothetical protein DCC55_35710 [Chloroflexi bacterium]|nr:MAG: hypothetical protein DCC55_35710 [Chloroflexota bacterium]